MSLSVQNFGLDVVFATETFHVRMESGEHTKWIPGSNDSFAVYSDEASQPPAFLLFVTDGDGATHAVDATPDGRILIDLAPIASSAVVALPTGEALNLSHATKLGELAANTPGGLYTGTICQTLDAAPPPSCIAQVTTSQPLLSPMNGTVSCEGGFVHLAGPAATLVFRIERAGSFDETVPCVGPAGRQVLAGDTIEADLIGGIEITALDAAGNPTPVVMAGDGTLYVGDIHPTVGCPCGGLN